MDISQIKSTASLEELRALQDELARKHSVIQLGNNSSFFQEIGLPRRLDVLRQAISDHTVALEYQANANNSN